MSHRGRLLLAISIVCLLVNMILPCVNAEIFDIGEKVSETSEGVWGDQWYYFDSGCVVETESDRIDFVPLLFDGNLSTGLNTFLGKDLGTFDIDVLFPSPIFVNNITLKPSFGGNTSNYSFQIRFDNSLTLAWKIGEEKTFQINSLIDAVHLDIFEENVFEGNGTGYYIFNDVIINYTPSITNLSTAIQSINNLTNTVNSLQNQINSLAQQIDILNNTINELNQTQLQILEDVTSLWSTYNQLNDSIANLFDEIDNLNTTTNETISLIINDLNTIENDLIDIHQSLDNLNSNVTELSEIQNLIDQTTHEIQYLDENITEIRNTMPSEYDDTAVTTRVFQLESENAALNNNIQNLTEKIENLEDKMDEPDDFVPLGAFVMGILGILIAIVAVILATRKSESEKPPEEREESQGDEDKVSEEDSDT